jgi:hypothetical protein
MLYLSYILRGARINLVVQNTSLCSYTHFIFKLLFFVVYISTEFIYLHVPRLNLEDESRD